MAIFPLVSKPKSKNFHLALVTGVSSGIGTALCHLLSKQGIPLLITGRDSAKLASLQKELEKHVKVVAFNGDLALARDRRKIIEKIHEFQPDLIINNAGFGLYGEALSYSTEKQMEILTVNGNAVLEITLEAARTLTAMQKTGVILNVSSAAAFYVFPYLATYAASKAFVTQFSQALDIELEPQGVRVLASCLGMVSTEFSTRAAGKKVEKVPNPYFAMSPETAAKHIWKQILSGKSCEIIDWKTKLATHFSKLFPKKWVAKILQADIKARL